MNSISAQNVSVRINRNPILHEVSFSLPDGESMAIVGLSGSGKTTLGKLICGLIKATSGQIIIPEGKVCLMVEQQDNLLMASHLPTGYYSQRYENLGLEDVPKVIDYLNSIAHPGKGNLQQLEVDSVLCQMDLLNLSGKKLLFLSNGERKRLQLAAALLQNPDILVLDLPFVGLDILSRKKLEELLIQLHDSGKTILLICDQEHIPEEINWVLELKNGTVTKLVRHAEFKNEKSEDAGFNDVNHLFDFVVPVRKFEFDFAVKMRNVNVTSNGNPILKNITWEVKKGERWALLGPNGAGKTTLLSLITADHPQGYCNDLTLFDRRRGSGESIWDIKRRIGFVSPEIHVYFLHGKGIFNTIPGIDTNHEYSGVSLPCESVISSGFHDLIGFTDVSDDFHKQIVNTWFSIMRLGHLAGRSFHEASLSEQRMLLLARALVKMPSMLILDEPCQGLDQSQTRRFNEMLDVICSKLDTTMIYVTHYPEEIPACVDFLLELEDGQIKGIKKF